jgi:hypothetical protein
MNLDRYPIKASTDFQEFKFLSIGPKGEIKKIVQFTEMSLADSALKIYNLAFGDHKEESEKLIDDLSVSDNKDPQKILATVAEAVMMFTNEKPGAFVFAQGSTPARARYYAMGVAANLHDLEKLFDIWGTLDGNGWELFQRNRRYAALLAKRR